MTTFLVALIALGSDTQVDVYSLTAPEITDTVFVAPDSTDEEFAAYTKELYRYGEDAARRRVEQLRLQDDLKRLAVLLYGNEEENPDEWGILFELPAYALEGADEPAWIVYLNIRRMVEDMMLAIVHKDEEATRPATTARWHPLTNH